MRNVAATTARVFRLPKTAYLPILLLTLGVTVLVQHPIAALAYLVPVAAVGYVARTATLVDEDGITVRALFGQTRLPWSHVRGLSVTGRNVYAVTADGAVRLPCVRLADLSAVAAASRGRLPALPAPTPKYAPQRRRR